MQALLFLVALLLPSGAGAGVIHKFVTRNLGFFVPEEIIGGVESKPHSRPYMAHLTIFRKKGYVVVCGGFLITRQFVLTAAHCRGRGITVTLGAHNLYKRESTKQKIKVEKQIVYSNSNASSRLHDIMLLKLVKQAELTPAVDVIPLPGPSDFVKPGTMCWAAGWGRTAVKKPLSSTLREVEMRIMEKKACKEYRRYNSTFQVCVGSPTKLGLAYKGDSGGPLVCAGVAHGIVSHGRGKGKPPIIFTRISSHMPWINTVIQGK